MRNLYTILGVSKKATAETIRKAFRKLALKHHPDRGGDAAKFNELQLAFDVLSDDGRRAKYDADGTIETAQKIDPLQGLIEALTPLFVGVVMEMTKAGLKASNIDVADAMRRAAEQHLGKLAEATKQNERSKVILFEAASRFSDDLMSSIVREQQRQLEVAMKQNDEQKAGLDKAVAYLKTCKYTFDPVMMFGGRAAMVTASNGIHYIAGR